MTVAVGTRLGPYEILALLGEGGMGAVWKARDTRLGRIVAIKVLKGAFSQRFEREAKAIAALNHPYIATLHDIGTENGVPYLVMEYVEGRPLGGPLPAEETIRRARQIAEALEAAHAKGITHRDLKPANILVTKSGIKLLDFGLAKATAQEAPPVDGETLTLPLTVDGAIEGTPQYMAPEQVEGKETDARSDLFALGCVLYELVSGRRAFQGDTVASVLASVLKDTPPPLPGDGVVERIVAACLAKDPADRWQSARDIRHALELPAETVRESRAPRWPWAVAAVGVVALAAGVLLMRGGAAPAVPLRFSIKAPEGVTFDASTRMTLSPDGQSVAFTAGSPSQVWVRRFDGPEARPIPGTEGADGAAWSPDGTRIAFVSGNRLYRIGVDGQGREALADCPNCRWPAWSPGGTVLVNSGGRALQVAETGGALRPLSEPRKEPYMLVGPLQALPDGRHYLRVHAVALGKAQVFRGVLDDTRPPVLVASLDTYPVFVPGSPSFYVYVRQGTLVATRAEEGTLRPAGDAVPLMDNVLAHPTPKFTAGTDAIVGKLGGEVRPMEIRTRQGALVRTVAKAGGYATPALSPDARRLAYAEGPSGTRGLRVLDLARGVDSLVADGRNGYYWYPVWSPDGVRLAVGHYAGRGSEAIFLASPDGSQPARQITEAKQREFPVGWSPDGRFVAYRAGGELLAVASGTPKPPPVRLGDGFGPNASISRDGRWVAYQDANEVFVRAFAFPGDTRPAGPERWQASAAGGRFPRWRADGRELFFQAADGMIHAVAVQPSGNGLSLDVPKPLFRVPLVEAGFNWGWDVFPNGQEFLVIGEPDAGAGRTLEVLLNWRSLVGRR